MKDFILKNKIIIVIIVIAFVAACSVLVSRMVVESNNKSYDVVLDYQETYQLAQQSDDMKIDSWLEEFKGMGITKIGLYEETIDSLMEGDEYDVTATMMDEVSKEVNWVENLDYGFGPMIEENGFSKYDVLVEAGSTEAFKFISSAYADRYDIDILEVQGDDGGYLLLKGTPQATFFTEKYKLETSTEDGAQEHRDIEGSRLTTLSLGLSPSKVELLQGNGMEIIPRTAGYNDYNTEAFAQTVIEGYESYGIDPEYWIGSGEAILGNDDSVEVISDYLKANDVTFALVEDTTQLQHVKQYGAAALTASLDNEVVRAFSVWNYIQYRYDYYGYEGAKEIENTLYRAIDERNIRLIYFKPIREQKDFHAYITDVDDYRELFSSLETRLAKQNFEFGSASVMPNLQINAILKIVIAMGAGFAALLLLCAVLPVGRKLKIGIGVIGAIGVVGAFFVLPNTAGLLASLGASIAFASLAAVFYTKQSSEIERNNSVERGEKLSFKKVLPLAIGTLICSVLIALIGGIMTAAPISTIDYMLELEVFRGVKIAQLLPIAVFAIIYLAYFGFGSKKKDSGRLELGDLKDMMVTPIKLWMVIVGVVVLAAGAYYILRTGHEFVSASSYEMIFRNFLEDNLTARPRNKEFLFGFPCIMMMVYAALRRSRFWVVIFGACGVIGMTSVINTFMHIRTPLYLGFIRTGYSLLFGLILGIIAIVVVELLYRLYKRIERQIVSA